MRLSTRDEAPAPGRIALVAQALRQGGLWWPSTICWCGRRRGGGRAREGASARAGLRLNQAEIEALGARLRGARPRIDG